jgi:hypothetical protein
VGVGRTAARWASRASATLSRLLTPALHDLAAQRPESAACVPSVGPQRGREAEREKERKGPLCSHRRCTTSPHNDQRAPRASHPSDPREGERQRERERGLCAHTKGCSLGLRLPARTIRRTLGSGDREHLHAALAAQRSGVSPFTPLGLLVDVDSVWRCSACEGVQWALGELEAAAPGACEALWAGAASRLQQSAHPSLADLQAGACVRAQWARKRGWSRVVWSGEASPIYTDPAAHGRECQGKGRDVQSHVLLNKPCRERLRGFNGSKGRLNV